MHLASPVLRSALLLAGVLACSASPSSSTGGESTSDASTATSSSDSSASAPTTGTAQPTTSSDPSTSTGTSTDDPGTSTATTTVDPSTSSTSDASTGPLLSTGDTGSTTADDTTSTGDDTTTGGSDGLGELSGDCGLIDAMELESPQAFTFANTIDLGVGGFDEALLTPGGQQMIAEGGLNDGSLKSEVIAYEVLSRCDGATLLKTEGKILYKDPMGKKTDILLEMGGHKVGVSVVRALGFPKEDPYTVAQATTILKKKLGDINISSENVAPEDEWIKQILHVVAYGPMHAESVLAAYAALDAPLKADTILVVSVTDGDDSLLY